MYPEYLIGNGVKISMTFNENGVVKFPSSVTIEFRSPSGQLSTHSMVSESLGTYKYLFDTTGKEPGCWSYYIRSIDPYMATEGAFSIKDKHLLWQQQ